MKKYVYRIGDVVQITNPIFVKRVGYPLGINDMLKELDTIENETKIQEFVNSFSKDQRKSNGLFFSTAGGCHFKALNEIRRGIAYDMLTARNFGGRERSLHTVELSEYKGREIQICGKKIVQTGWHEPGSSSIDYWTGEVDYEQAYLSDRKSHILLDLGWGFISRDIIDDHTLWIEAVNVKPIK